MSVKHRVLVLAAFGVLMDCDPTIAADQQQPASAPRAGFADPQAFKENVSDDALLRDLEERDVGVNDRWNNYETMSVEAGKPRQETTRE